MPTRREKADALMARLEAIQPRTYPQDTVSASEIVLRLSGDIGAFKPVNAERVRVALSRYPNATAEFVINSRGGSVLEAERIAALITAHRGQTIATVHDECSSAACHILLAAKFRQCAPQATFLLHQVAMEPLRDERWTATRHRKTVKTLEEFDRRLVAFYAKQTGYPRAEFEKEIKTEKPLTPAAAHRFGLVHAYIGDAQWRGGKLYGWPIVDRAAGHVRLGRRAGRVWPVL